MLLQPGLQGAGGLARGRLGPRRVSIRVLTVGVEPLSGVDGQGGSVGSGTVLQLVLGPLEMFMENELLAVPTFIFFSDFLILHLFGRCN